MNRSSSRAAVAPTSKMPNGPAVVVDGLVKTYEDSGSKGAKRIRAVDQISFTVDRGTMFTLLGPSGCGKTTTLRCIAGLEQPDEGRIVVDGRTFSSTSDGVDVPVHQRGLGMVFQSYAIWPHLDVYENVAFPLLAMSRRQRSPRKDIRRRVQRVLDVVQLGELVNRPATDLSGGQQQRLALARALVMEPPLLLLDEPLSNLDAKLREEMRFELKRLQRDLGITTLYVTHDQIEALSMSKYIAVMDGGGIEQIGRPREIYDRPASRFVADFIGVSNLFAGKVTEIGPGDSLTVETEYGLVRATAAQAMPRGSDVLVVVRPEQIEIEESAGEASEWTGSVRARAFVGDAVEHMVRMRNGTDARVKSAPTVSIPPGTTVHLGLKPEGITVVPAG